MSVLGILAGDLLNQITPQFQSTQSTNQNFQQEFQQLGEDLEAGNLSAAQSDLATLQQYSPQSSSASSSTSSSQSSNSIAQEFNQLSQNLQSGNLTAAEQDYSTIQQDFQNQAQNHAAHGFHHHHSTGSETDGINQLLQQLGEALQSGNLSSAQQAYNTLDQALQPSYEGIGQSSSQTTSPTSTVSVSA
jgi:predicted nuclease of predicted toxin-antitoxin system